MHSLNQNFRIFAPDFIDTSKMNTDNLTQILTQTVEKLSAAESLKGLFHQHREGDPLPSSKALEEIIELSRSILFPGYFGKSTVNTQTIKYHIGVNVERLRKLLTDQITMLPPL